MKHGPRVKRVSIRFTLEEFEEIAKIVSNHEYHLSVSEFIRVAIFKEMKIKTGE